MSTFDEDEVVSDRAFEDAKERAEAQREASVPPKVEDEYLGDGVYASFDGYHVVLDLRAQGSDKIALEPNVIVSLFEYVKKTGVKYE